MIFQKRVQQNTTQQQMKIAKNNVWVPYLTISFHDSICACHMSSGLESNVDGKYDITFHHNENVTLSFLVHVPIYGCYGPDR